MGLFNPFIISLVAGIVLAFALIGGALTLVRLGRVHTTSLKQVGSSLLRWAWVPALLYWTVLSAGIFSELAFLIASVWKSVNASDHEFVLLFVSELQSKQATYWANSAYIVLSVCILPLAAITTYGHVKTWRYEKKRFCAPALWAILYGSPTLTFLVIDIAIISSSSPTYTLPDLLVSARSIMAYVYGLTAIIYHFVGKQQEADRLKEKDDFISQLVEQASVLSGQIDAVTAELEHQKRAIEEEKAARKRVLEEMQKSDDAALQAYGDECLNWLRSGIKTASLDEITRFTGHSKRKITNAISSANLQVSPRNKELVLVSSLVSWLKNTPTPVGKTETELPALHLVNE